MSWSTSQPSCSSWSSLAAVRRCIWACRRQNRAVAEGWNPTRHQASSPGNPPAQPGTYREPDQQPGAEARGSHHQRPPRPPPAVAPLFAFLVAAALVGGLSRGAGATASRVEDRPGRNGGPCRHRPDLLGQLLDPGPAQALDRERGAGAIGSVATAGPVMLAALGGHYGPPVSSSGSAASWRRASALAARAWSETSGQLRSSEPIVSTRMAATIACMTGLWSAGMTYQGAQGVDVAVMASSNARM